MINGNEHHGLDKADLGNSAIMVSDGDDDDDAELTNTSTEKKAGTKGGNAASRSNKKGADISKGTKTTKKVPV